MTNLAVEFSDGILFERLFNCLYDEHLNCMLEPSALYETRLLNWNRINVCICFNYLQQKFYFMEPTMKALAKGNSLEVTMKAIKTLIDTHQNDYSEAVIADTSGIKDIADQLTTSKALFGVNEATGEFQGALPEYKGRAAQFEYLLTMENPMP